MHRNQLGCYLSKQDFPEAWNCLYSKRGKDIEIEICSTIKKIRNLENNKIVTVESYVNDEPDGDVGRDDKTAWNICKPVVIEIPAMSREHIGKLKLNLTAICSLFPISWWSFQIPKKMFIMKSILLSAWSYVWKWFETRCVGGSDERSR